MKSHGRERGENLIQRFGTPEEIAKKHRVPLLGRFFIRERADNSPRRRQHTTLNK